MKKIVCGLVGVIAAVNSVSALTTEEIKQRCMAAGNRVWDAKNQKCISKNPCKEYGIDDVYCFPYFINFQVASSVDAKKLVDAYFKELPYGVSCENFEASEAGAVGDDYIRCHLSDGGYLEFVFDDFSESIQSTADYWFATGMCAIYRGVPSDVTKEVLRLLKFDYITDQDFLLNCTQVTEEKCNAMYSGQAIYSPTNKFCLPKKGFIY